MAANGKQDERITALELSLTHLQNDFESLNEMVLKNGNRLDTIELLIKRLTTKLESQIISNSERDIDEEKPPHY